jgi:superfamily I DNA and/or RNA helicase
MLDFMEDWCKKPSIENGDNGTNLWINSILKDMDENEKYASVLEQWKIDLTTRDRKTREQFFEAYKSNVNLVAATCSICGSKQLQEIYALLFGNNENAFDVVIMDEASKATPLEMSVPMVWGKKIIIIGDHKQLPPMMNEDNIITSLKKAGQIVKAEAIESFQDSQFEILFRSAFKLKPSIVATLDTQYRMHKQIMNTVGHFYSEELEEGLKCGLPDDAMDDKDYNARGSRYHGLTLPGFIEPQTHAIWVDVDTFESQPKGSTSYVNNGELNAIRTVVKALKKAEGFQQFMESQGKPEDKEIGIITFYGAQYGKIKEMYREGKIDKTLPFRINVVDKFQGMERNIIIISTVRSNKEHRYGFAEDIRRINVGFSRARRLLIVIGNRQFFRQNAHYHRSIDEMEHFEIKQLEDLVR